MQAENLSNELLDYLMTPPKTFLYWRIKDTYLIVAIIEKWDETTITLKTEEGMVSKEKRTDVKIMVP
ncbi:MULTISPECIES: hypothetical protein [Acinetobacter]|uniref:Uncharacterized protein n=1 Tax=Acinetobacter bereziniae TaxID=106648 RepID=A0A8B5RXD7_ACIBZ|nr:MULTISPECIES: hypothetical protein [Acinetobacter]MEC8124018.1 hypothetical protein [Pseudomonadota bacterium]ATZ65126.1 hypothetical protein BSR55_18225 [Acinetobacter bereziniae]MBI0396649.1 hypothetical protein [Acinetobacter bereziniae]MBJ8423525.1 hypothetical protein [Acinetobacter bereziniae]MBJ8445427.1 hypothetical protein [Acinetobacter bereziniae]